MKRKELNKVTKYVIFNGYLGLLLGVHSRGDVFFSHDNSGGQKAAVTFNSEEECAEFLEGFEGPEDILHAFEFRQVSVAKGSNFLRREEAEKQGLPYWHTIPPKAYWYWNNRIH